MSVANELSAQAGFESIPYQEEIASAFCGADLSGEPNRALATFAGGCFWCMVAPFQQQPSVEQVVSGHTGGHEENPTYQQVADGSTGHFEAIQVTFD